MNAIQFIKEHGVDKAREVMEFAPQGATHLSDDTRHYVNAEFKPLPNHIKEQLPKLVVIDDLKRLVESVDIIKELGGIHRVKRTYKSRPFELAYSDLKQAIADYDAIYSNDCEILDHPEDYTSPNCKKFDERVK